MIRNSILILIYLWLIFNSGCKNSEEYDTNSILRSHEKGLIYYYQPLIDSTSFDQFKSFYLEAIDSALLLNNKVEFFAERIKNTNDSIKIEFLSIYKIGRTYYGKSVQNNNGTITIIQAKRIIHPPEVPISCNDHFVYLSYDSTAKNLWNSYSIFDMNLRRQLKVFYSSKFDAFNNTKSPCDEEVMGHIAESINQSFDRD